MNIITAELSLEIKWTVCIFLEIRFRQTIEENKLEEWVKRWFGVQPWKTAY